MKPFVFLAASLLAITAGATDPAAHVPAAAPRTMILAGRHEAFRTYVTNGPGAAAFARIREDFDQLYAHAEFPPEPLTYGDPSPRARDTARADRWREAQDVCGFVSGIAEAAALLWIVTGEERYFAKAREFLLRSTVWSLDGSRWRDGPSRGATAIDYNDEAHFRLWRKLPLVYDQLRDRLTAAERERILAHFRERGRQSLAFILRARTDRVRYNSLEVVPSSHPVRFMPMTGLAALALWDDLPEAREWWASAHRFYREQFPPWGGDDGGWAEGAAYWRGTIEHAAFHDTLLAIGDPLAYGTPFWRQTAYFPLYTVQPYLHSTFGDLSNAGKFNLEPLVAEFLLHLARVLGDGRLVSYAALCTDERPSPAERGLRGLDRLYPTAAEFLVRNFLVADRPVPEAVPLDTLPPDRHFRDIGWVAMHSALGRPADDIHITFKSSPYGSFSHSHADQNAFVLLAYGENLAIASGYREFHNSPHHDGWTRLTKSKNTLLIDGMGQKPQDRAATGRITRFESGGRAVWTTGDATVAYQTLQPAGRVRRVTRDLVFVDRRYLVVRDVVELATPGRVTWLLHAERPIAWDAGHQAATITAATATLSTRLLADGTAFTARVQQGFDVPVDPKYAGGGPANYTSTGRWTEQSHLFAETTAARHIHVIHAVLWPERGTEPAVLGTRLAGDGWLEVQRPDGRVDRIRIGDDRLEIP